MKTYNINSCNLFLKFGCTLLLYAFTLNCIVAQTQLQPIDGRDGDLSKTWHALTQTESLPDGTELVGFLVETPFSGMTISLIIHDSEGKCYVYCAESPAVVYTPGKSTEIKPIAHVYEIQKSIALKINELWMLELDETRYSLSTVRNVTYDVC